MGKIFWVFGFLGLAMTSQAIPERAAAQETVEGLAPEYEVVAIRRASDVIGGPNDRSVARVGIGAKVTFGKTLKLPWGRTCLGWSVAKSQQPGASVGDPLLSDTQILPPGGTKDWPDHRVNRRLVILCNGKAIASVLKVDERVAVLASPSGMSNLILERPLGPIETATLQKKLKSMKFYDGEPSGNNDAATRRAVARYAEYLGAKFAFQRGAITSNLLEGLLTKKAKNGSVLELVKVIHSGPVSAHFMGVVEPLAPRTYGVRELWFTFKGDPRRYRFKPTGSLAFSDWYFDHLYSPNGSRVLLLQDRFGPYHVVGVKRLRAYLQGKRAPDHVVGKIAVKGEPAAVHGDAVWIDENQIRYSVTCCGETTVKSHSLN